MDPVAETALLTYFLDLTELYAGTATFSFATSPTTLTLSVDQWKQIGSPGRVLLTPRPA